MKIILLSLVLAVVLGSVMYLAIDSYKCPCGYTLINAYYGVNVLECERVIEGCCPGENICDASPRFNMSVNFNKIWDI